MRYILIVLTSCLFIACGNDQEELSIENDSLVELKEVIEPETIVPLIKYNIDFTDYDVLKLSIKKDEALSHILNPRGIDYPEIQKIIDLSKGVFSARKLQTGKPYTLLIKKDSTQTLDYMIYEIDAIDYVVYDFTDSVRVYRGKKPVTILEKTASGIIETSLWNTMMQNDLNQDLILSLADVYAWTIDFYHLQKGDAFKVIYTERQVEGVSVGVEQILAAEFIHFNNPIYAYLFESDSILDYFDADGKNLRKAFLRAPVKFSRISSRYTGKRFHPVQKRYKAHLGTDYAAASGTPIMATGDGVVIESAYGKFNGNYVKVKHNATYTTQYLHMSKRAAKKGDRVLQGETIGYVGSTGLATGPHVCYRFWKNGKQVDPYRQELPESTPVKAEEMEAFEKVKAEYAPRLNSIIIENKESLALAGTET
jgi:murein DD-endopeptidase MepM/ murein hydrolase activator NlpD